MATVSSENHQSLVYKKFPGGTDNFRKMITQEFVFVDKSEFIKELIDADREVSLITRPRRWGKTLNLSMLQHFLAEEVDGEPTADLFKNLAIAKAKMPNGKSYIDEYQGKYPVIFISFKDVQGNNLKEALANIYVNIIRLYKEHKYLLKSEKLDEDDKATIHETLTGFKNSSDEDKKAKFSIAIQELSKLLRKHRNNRCYILIDEYDTPLNIAYEKEYLADLTRFMRELFSAALKGNQHLAQGVITGILCVSQNSMLSGLNNLDVYHVLNHKYSQDFGFTEMEIQSILQTQGNTTVSMIEIKDWYNGYQVGQSLVFNPWSIMQCLNPDNQGKLQSYWSNTGSTKLIEQVLLNSNTETLQQFTQLIANQNGAIQTKINQNITYDDLMRTNNNTNVWSLLLFSGYLTATIAELEGSGYQCILKIPNREVGFLYREIFVNWLENSLGTVKYHGFLANLVCGNVEQFKGQLSDYMMTSTSFYDMTSERDYHVFLLGLILGVHETHHVFSNQEAGLGRVDIALIPKSKTNYLGIILEVKIFKSQDFPHDKKSLQTIRKGLEECASEGLQQIHTRGYDYAFATAPHVNEVLHIGLAFHKRCVGLVAKRRPTATDASA